MVKFFYILLVNRDHSYVVYEAKNEKGSVKVTILCNSKLDKPNFTTTKNQQTKPYIIEIEGKAKEACPFFSLSNFYNDNRIPFSIGFIGAGIIIAFLGFRIFNVVLFLMATFVVAFILFNVIFQLSASKITMENAWVVWIIMGAAGIIGAIAGFFAAKFQKYCFFLAGACLGGIIGFMIYTAFLTTVGGAVFCCY